MPDREPKGGADAEVVRYDDPFLHGMKWPDVTVTSEEFRDLPTPDRLYELARGFLRAARRLCERAGEAGPALQWSDASVCYYAVYHATELFLKACLWQRSPERGAKLGSEKDAHDVGYLLREYIAIMPGSDAALFHTPWALSAKELDNIVGCEVFRGVDRTPDQLFRYSADKKGAPSHGVQFFTPGYMFNYLAYLEERWTVLWASICEADGEQADAADDAIARMGRRS
jgi:hypothetical protein